VEESTSIINGLAEISYESHPQKRPSKTTALAPSGVVPNTFHSSLTSSDDRKAALKLAVKRARARSRIQSTALIDNLKILYPDYPLKNATAPDPSERRLINLIRIPKAGSSALSATARALVGCGPDGYACCDALESEKKITPSCPLVDLSCPAVRGCTGHYPNYTYTTTRRNVDDHWYEPTITTLRHPSSRALSGFFYVAPHRPSGGCRTWTCFEQGFVRHPRWRNHVTKCCRAAFPI
jgi:hypothetical protein